jgi:hypothetical protein
VVLSDIEIQAIIDADGVDKGLQLLEKSFDDFQKRLSRQSKQLQQDLLAVGLSILFTGMAIKRVTDGALRAIYQTAELAYGEISAFSVITGQLAAKWEFFKFSLVDALMQTSVFTNFISFLNELLDTLNGLSPTAKSNITVALLMLSLLAGAFVIVGQYSLFAVGMMKAFGLSSAMYINRAVGALGILALAFLALQPALDESNDNIDRWTSGITASLLALAGGLLVGGAALVSVFGAAILAGAVFFGMRFKEELGLIFGHIINFVVQSALKALELLTTVFFSPLFYMYDKVSKLFGGAGTDFRPSQHFAGMREQFNVFHEGRMEDLRAQRAAREKSQMEQIGVRGIQDLPHRQSDRDFATATSPMLQQHVEIGEINLKDYEDLDEIDRVTDHLMDRFAQKFFEETGTPLR